MTIRRENNLEYICEGCERITQETQSCGVYADVPPYYLHHKCCPFNMPKQVVKKEHVRVGQQKNKAASE